MWPKTKGVPLSQRYPFLLRNTYGPSNVVKMKLCDYNVSILSRAENLLQYISKS